MQQVNTLPSVFSPLAETRAALSEHLWIKPLAVGPRNPRELYCHVLSKRYVAKSGGQVVSGWVAEKSVPASDWYCVYTHHSIVRRPNEAYVDPSFNDKAPLFLPDPLRTYDFETKTGYNSVLVATEPFMLFGTLFPAQTPVWVRFSKGGILDASLDSRHSRFRTVYNADDVSQALADLGFQDRTAIRDALFCSTINLHRQEYPALPLKRMELTTSS